MFPLLSTNFIFFWLEFVNVGISCCKLWLAIDGCLGSNVSSRASLYALWSALWKIWSFSLKV
jgi:hypothetical protein